MTLYLIDAYAMIYRAYYSFINKPMTNSKGENTSAVLGFVNMLGEIINTNQPTHMAVVFDPPYPTFRNLLSPEYKAQRPPTPEGIKTALPHIKEIVDALGIKQVTVPQYEADDAIGTLAKQAEEKGFEVFMVTPDKDYNQLVTDNIKLYKHKKSNTEVEIIDRKAFIQSTGLDYPKQFIDVLALWGDAADNVKGVTGVGEKTAYKLINEYKSIEGIYQNINKLKGKQKENFINDHEQVLLAQKLVTIDTNAPITFDPEQYIKQNPDEEKLRAIFAELEFRTLADRILGKKKQPAQQDLFAQGTLFNKTQQEEQPKQKLETIKTITHDYEVISTIEQTKSLVDILLKQNEFCFDTETTSLSIRQAELVGMSFCTTPHKAYYIPFNTDKQQTQNILEIIRPALENKDINKIGQNIKFDILVLKNYGIEVKGQLFDTMVAHYLLNPEQRHNMDYMSEIYLNYTPVHIEELIGAKGKSQKSMRNVDIQIIKEYAAEDADITLQLKEKLQAELKKNELIDYARNIEMPLIYVLADMEYEGVSINTEFLNNYTTELNQEIATIEQKIYQLSATKFNIDSPKQLGEILFDKLQIKPAPKKTKTGQYSTGEEELSKLKNNEIIDLILKYRGLKKLVSTYTEALPALINPVTGKIHTSFNQTVTATGRLSSTNPNIQNIPIRTPEGQKIRAAFIPSPNNKMFSTDYSQIELRVMAHFANDENLISAFEQGMDIHRATAAKIYGITPEQVSKQQRSHAKSANFGIIYGISSFGLAAQTGLSRTEAKQMIDNYFLQYPKIREFIDNTTTQARQNGFVSTMYGRKRFLPDLNSQNFNVRTAAERNAINTPIQGTAAEIIKIAMIKIWRKFKEQNLKSKLIIQVHDELVFDVVQGEEEIVKNIVETQMENAAKLKVILKAEGGFGSNWFEAH